jgi:uncharacterized membrane protein
MSGKYRSVISCGLLVSGVSGVISCVLLMSGEYRSVISGYGQ